MGRVRGRSLKAIAEVCGRESGRSAFEFGRPRGKMACADSGSTSAQASPRRRGPRLPARLRRASQITVPAPQGTPPGPRSRRRRSPGRSRPARHLVRRRGGGARLRGGLKGRRRRGRSPNSLRATACGMPPACRAPALPDPRRRPILHPPHPEGWGGGPPARWWRGSCLCLSVTRNTKGPARWVPSKCYYAGVLDAGPFLWFTRRREGAKRLFLLPALCLCVFAALREIEQRPGCGEASTHLCWRSHFEGAGGALLR